jgi:hypothetical protein
VLPMIKGNLLMFLMVMNCASHMFVRTECEMSNKRVSFMYVANPPWVDVEKG